MVQVDLLLQTAVIIPKILSSFLDFHLQHLAREVKSYIKDINDFMKKLRSLTNLPDDTVLCAVDEKKKKDTHCSRLCKTIEIFVRIKNVFFLYLIFTPTHLVSGI